LFEPIILLKMLKNVNNLAMRTEFYIQVYKLHTVMHFIVKYYVNNVLVYLKKIESFFMWLDKCLKLTNGINDNIRPMECIIVKLGDHHYKLS